MHLNLLSCLNSANMVISCSVFTNGGVSVRLIFVFTYTYKLANQLALRNQSDVMNKYENSESDKQFPIMHIAYTFRIATDISIFVCFFFASFSGSLESELI